ncbi:MAG: hypothetical protein R2685_10910 [Candidatus Nitrosocosmicus sp.]|nr:hypothetical protein [Candidatus Nitrosocosmicus sp.]
MSNLNPSDKIFVTDNKEFEDKLEKMIVDYFARSNRTLGTGKLHTSSLTYCIRDQVIRSWLIQTGKNKPEDFLDIYAGLNFQRGLESEAFLSKLFGDLVTTQMDTNLDNISAHPDVVAKDGSFLLELKNSNTYTTVTLDSDNILSYLYQTIIYLCATNIDIGHIIIIRGLPHNLTWTFSDKGVSNYAVQSLKKIGERPFKVITVNLSKHSPLRDQIKASLNKAYEHITKQDYTDENTIKQFPRLEGYPDNMKCKYCSVKKHCDKIEPELKDEEIVKALLNKVIKDNIVKIKDQ